jgi:hypothetical protein
MTIIEYLLITLAEEHGEVQKAISKSLRFTLEDRPPKDKGYRDVPNSQYISEEMLDVIAIEDMLLTLGVDLRGYDRATLPWEKEVYIQEKYQRVFNTLITSVKLGILDPLSIAPLHPLTGSSSPADPK